MLDTGFDDAGDDDGGEDDEDDDGDDDDGRVSLNCTLNTLEFRVHGPCLSYCVFTMHMKEQVLRYQMKGNKAIGQKISLLRIY